MDDLRSFLVRATMDADFRALVLDDPDQAFEGYALSESDKDVLRRGDQQILALIGKALEEETTTAEAPPLPVRDAVPETPAVQLPDLQFELTLSPTQIGNTIAYRATVAPKGHAPSTTAPATDPLWGHKLGSVAARDAATAVLAAEPHERRGALEDLVLALKDADAEETEPAPELVDGAPAVTVVGLGIKNLDHLTLETEAVLREADTVFYLDTGLATREILEARCDHVVALFAESYTERGSRLDAYHHIAVRVVEAALDHGNVVFAIQGHPTVFCYPPFLIRDLCRMVGLPCTILPGISAMDCLFAELGVDPSVHGMQLYEATDILLRRRPLQPDVPALIWQVGTVETRLHSRNVSAPGRFDRLKSWLMRFYPANHPITAVFSSPHPLVPSTRFTFPLQEIGAYANALHPGITLYLPPVASRPIHDLELLQQLDSPEHLATITR